MKQPYNDHESWNAWNVSLWIGSEEYLYRAAMEYLARHKRTRVAACEMIRDLGLTRTPDGARYSIHAVTLALQGLKD